MAARRFAALGPHSRAALRTLRVNPGRFHLPTGVLRVIVHTVIPFRLTFQPGVSIYEQVVYAAKKAMIAGQMRPGDAFPSVRALSTQLEQLVVEAKKLRLNLDDVTQAVTDHWERLDGARNGRKP